MNIYNKDSNSPGFVEQTCLSYVAHATARSNMKISSHFKVMLVICPLAQHKEMYGSSICFIYHLMVIKNRMVETCRDF
jgi:hypothetical protein